ncbi:MAG: hypothetical protein ACJ78Q_12395 [Chloroflexia bacterium]|jgi:hypothetical protein
MAKGRHREANKPRGERGVRGRKEGPRRIVRIDEVEAGDLGEGFTYKIERWTFTTGATEYALYVELRDNVGVVVGRRSKYYGQLDHAQAGIDKLLSELRLDGSARA